MKLGMFGDLHYTDKAPERRKDDYYQTLRDKVQQALSIFAEERCDWVFQPGDFFDSPQVGNRVKADVIRMLKDCPFKVLACAGQHDIFGHSLETLPSSPLSVLQAADVVTLLGEKEFVLSVGNQNTKCFQRKIAIYGASFGEEIPTPESLESLNILVIHRMIGNYPLWPDQPLEDPRSFLRKYPAFSVVLAGDYHYRFSDRYQGRVIVNPGAVVRKTISKFDLELRPAVCILDLEDLSLKTIELKFQPVEEVFDLTRKPDAGKHNEALNAFVESLRNQNQIKTGWKVILSKVISERKPKQSVRDLIDKVLEEAKA